MTARITDIQRFCMHDGPGIRTTVFFSGCPLRCKWCHNPETQKAGAQMYYNQSKCIGCGGCTVTCPNGAHVFSDGHLYDRARCTACGACAAACPSGAVSSVSREMEISDIVAEIKKDVAFYGDGGGMTLSGGEPMAQPEASIALLGASKDAGLSTALETCGYFPAQYVKELAAVTDLFLWDFKDSDDARHRENTGVSNAPILENLRAADKTGVPIVLRCILLKGINFNEAHLREIRALRDSLAHCIRVDLLPYHPMGDSKNTLLGQENGFHDKKYIVTPEEIQSAYAFINQ